MYLSKITNFLDNIFPPKCVCCGQFVRIVHTLCVNCWKKIDFITEPSCITCGYPLESNTVYCSNECKSRKTFLYKIKSATIYNDTLINIIHGIKYQDKTENSLLLSNWLYTAGSEMAKEADLIIPVPLHKTKLLKRKYNQSAIIAKEFSKKVQKKCEFNVLIKKKNVKNQSSLSKLERITNIRGAFCTLNQKKIQNKTILLIDDVMTTSATVNECAKILLQSGAKKVMCLTAARAKIRGIINVHKTK